MRVYLLLLLLCLMFGQSSLVFASGGCDAESPDCVEVGKWQVSVALGAGVRTNPVVGGKEIPLIVLPEIAYNGERFFIHNLDLGAILWESPTQQFNLLLTPSFDQVFFHRWDPANFVLETTILAQPGSVNNPIPEREGPDKSEALIDAEFTKKVDVSGLHKRRMAALAGLEYGRTIDDWDIQAQWLKDISGIHDGTELRLAIARHYRWDRHAMVLSVGANWQSAAVTDYYYGIRTDEVALVDDAYRADAGISSFARVDWHYALSKRWTLRFTGSYRQLADEISRSPIIDDDRVLTAFFGGVYHF
jgi:outer membrane protein